MEKKNLDPLEDEIITDSKINKNVSIYLYLK